MKHSGRIVLALILLAVAAVIWHRFDEYILKNAFLLEASTSCDPSEESCFTSDCSVDDPGCDLEPYKKVEILANEAPSCLEEHSCEDFACPNGSESCSITYCSEEALEEGEACTEPEPAEEEPLPVAPEEIQHDEEA